RKFTALHLFLIATFDDKGVGILPSAGLIPLCQLAPGGDRMGIPLSRLSFSSAVRMIDRVHRHPSDGRTPSHPPRSSRLAVRIVLMVDVADLSDRRHALGMDQSDFARAEPDLRPFSLFHLDVVDGTPDRDIG